MKIKIRVQPRAKRNQLTKMNRQAGELQAEWKTVGPGPRKQQRELWNRFRTACNSFFARRKADLAARKQQWSSNLRIKEALCERVEELAGVEDLPAAMTAVKQAQAEFQGLAITMAGLFEPAPGGTRHAET